MLPVLALYAACMRSPPAGESVARRGVRGGVTPAEEASPATSDATAQSAEVWIASGTPSASLPADLAHIVFSGASGRDCDHPVKIENARNTGEGMAAEK